MSTTELIRGHVFEVVEQMKEQNRLLAIIATQLEKIADRETVFVTPYDIRSYNHNTGHIRQL